MNTSIDIRELGDAIADVLDSRKKFDEAFDRGARYEADYYLRYEREQVERAEERLAAVFTRAVAVVVAGLEIKS